MKYAVEAQSKVICEHIEEAIVCVLRIRVSSEIRSMDSILRQFKECMSMGVYLSY